MRLGIQLLNQDATLNSFKVYSQIVVGQGETFNLTFQLVDLDQPLQVTVSSGVFSPFSSSGSSTPTFVRYVPAAGATVFVEIPRLPEAFATVSNVRQIKDYSVRRLAMAPFPLDTSIWRLPLLPSDTANMMSTNMRVTVTQGSTIYVATMPQAIVCDPSESP